MNINEIAKLAKVSKTTISFYLNNKTEKMSKATYEKIKKIITKYNYVPEEYARKLRTKVSNDIGIVVGDMSQEFSINLFRTIKTTFDKSEVNKFNIFLFETKLNFAREKNILLHLLNQKVRSIVIQPSLQLEAQLDKIIAKSDNKKTQIILIDPKKHYLHYSTFIRQYQSSIHSLIQSYQSSVDEIIFITEPLEKLATRFLRSDLIKKEAQINKLNFQLCEFEFENSEANIVSCLQKNKIQLQSKLIICNNSETMLLLLTLIKKMKWEIKYLKLATFNKCNFATLIDANIKVIITNTKKVALKIVQTIKNNNHVNQNINV